MNIKIASQIKSLRESKNVSQTKLAEFLNISFQSVSKWENGLAYPDITLLPKLAGFLGVTVDELLGVSEIEKSQRYEEYENKAEELYKNGLVKEHLILWKEAYDELPNNYDVKQYLMCAYSDIDKQKYFNEIIELAMDIYHNDINMYNKAQAIRIISNTYFENNDKEKAIQWANKSVPIYCSADIISYQFYEGEELMRSIHYNVYWFLEELWHMTSHMVYGEKTFMDLKFKQDYLKNTLSIYESVYPNCDTFFNTYDHYYCLYGDIAKFGVSLGNSEDEVKYYLEKALECAEKSSNLKGHLLKSPLMYNKYVEDAPNTDKRLVIVNQMRKFLNFTEFDIYRNKEWFQQINKKLSSLN